MSAVLPKLVVEWCTAWKGTISMLPLHQLKVSVNSYVLVTNSSGHVLQRRCPFMIAHA